MQPSQDGCIPLIKELRRVSKEASARSLKGVLISKACFDITKNSLSLWHVESAQETKWVDLRKIKKK